MPNSLMPQQTDGFDWLQGSTVRVGDGRHADEFKFVAAYRHRNGVGGEGFWQVMLEGIDDEGAAFILAAIVTDSALESCKRFMTNGGRDYSWQERVYVVQVTSHVWFAPTKWRGDQFAEALVPTMVWDRPTA